MFRLFQKGNSQLFKLVNVYLDGDDLIAMECLSKLSRKAVKDADLWVAQVKQRFQLKPEKAQQLTRFIPKIQFAVLYEIYLAANYMTAIDIFFTEATNEKFIKSNTIDPRDIAQEFNIAVVKKTEKLDMFIAKSSNQEFIDYVQRLHTEANIKKENAIKTYEKYYNIFFNLITDQKMEEDSKKSDEEIKKEVTTYLRVLCKCNATVCLDIILKQQDKFNELYDSSLLKAACVTKNLRALKKLVELGADINAPMFLNLKLSKGTIFFKAPIIIYLIHQIGLENLVGIEKYHHFFKFLVGCNINLDQTMDQLDLDTKKVLKTVNLRDYIQKSFNSIFNESSKDKIDPNILAEFKVIVELILSTPSRKLNKVI